MPINDENLYEKLSEIHESLASLKTAVDIRHANIEEMLSKHDRTLNGNGTPGIIKQVDRIEQTQEARKWHFRTLWGGLIVVALKLIGDIVTKRAGG